MLVSLENKLMQSQQDSADGAAAQQVPQQSINITTASTSRAVRKEHVNIPGDEWRHTFHEYSSTSAETNQ